MTNDNWRVFIFNNPPFGVSKSNPCNGFYRGRKYTDFPKTRTRIGFRQNRVQMHCTVRSVSAWKFVDNIENRTSKNTQIISHVNNAEMTKRDLRKDRYLRDYPRGNFRNPRFPIRVVGNACENFTLVERNRAARTKRERRSSDR